MEKESVHIPEKAAQNVNAFDDAVKKEKVKTIRNPLVRGVFKVLDWFGNAVMDVPPKHRFYTAAGLTIGLTLGKIIAETISGIKYHGDPTKMSDAPKLLQPMHGIMKFDRFDTHTANRLKYGFFRILPAIGGFLGVAFGSKFAFRNQAKEFKNPVYLEQYMARINLAQSEVWRWGSAFTADLASASGVSLIPIPAVNYGMTLAMRSVGGYDKRFMLPGVGKLLSNNYSNFQYGLEDGLNHIINYATYNSNREPERLPEFALMVLGPLFGKELKKEHIDGMVSKIMGIRMKYYQPGGVPRDAQPDLKEELMKHFRKEGFEVTLEELGLDPLKIDFNMGLVGKISNKIATQKKYDALVHEYREKYQERREARMGGISESKTTECMLQADEMRKHGHHARKHKPSNDFAADFQPSASHKERAATTAAATAHGRQA